jgi:hypothetical protein
MGTCTITTDVEGISMMIRRSFVRSIRWDVIPWCLVFDLDVESDCEDQFVSLRRGWLIFQSTLDVTMSLKKTRIGMGFGIEGRLKKTRSTDYQSSELFDYSFDCCLCNGPLFEQSGELSVSDPVVVCAKSAVLLVSEYSVRQSKNLGFGERESLVQTKDLIELYYEFSANRSGSV